MRFNIEYSNMYEITNDLYEEVYDVIRETICGTNHYSGTICALFPDGVEWALSMSVVMIGSELIEIWWDFQTTLDGDVLMNDFSFSKIKELWKKNGVSD